MPICAASANEWACTRPQLHAASERAPWRAGVRLRAGRAALYERRQWARAEQAREKDKEAARGAGEEAAAGRGALSRRQFDWWHALNS